MSCRALGALAILATAVGFLGCGSGEGGARVAPADPAQDAGVAAQPESKLKTDAQAPSGGTSLVP